MTNRKNGVLYTGVTSDLVRRVYQHKSGEARGFVGKYRTNMLVYFELHDDMLSAITREKQIKKYLRKRKEALINNANPQWRDLYPDII